MNRKLFGLAIAAALIAGAPGFVAAQDKVRIGYAISKSEPNAGGANITQIPNYEMWVKEVNAKGADARRQACADRGDRVRRPLDRRGGDPCSGAASSPGLGAEQINKLFR